MNPTTKEEGLDLKASNAIRIYKAFYKSKYLSPQRAAVLCCFYDGEVMTSSKLAFRLGIPRKSIRTILKVLHLSYGFIRPAEKRGEWQATQKGLDEIEDMFPDTYRLR